MIFITIMVNVVTEDFTGCFIKYVDILLTFTYIYWGKIVAKGVLYSVWECSFLFLIHA